jgi:nitrogen fixation NifU-like protein
MNDLEGLYREIILDHYRSPRNRGELPVPPAEKLQGYNPLCGDEITIYLDKSNGVIDLRIQGKGCSISQSSASLMSQAVKGKNVDGALELIRKFKTLMSIHESNMTDESDDGLSEAEIKELGELAALQGVVKFPVRIKCAVLSWNTLLQGLSPAENSQ